MTELRLHDTMAREKRVFTPADPKRVTLYVCGPTVYGRAHIGNARPAVVFDVLARLLRHVYGADSLVYARNVTDVDDKIIEAARAQAVEPAVITERYERHYLEDMGALGVQPPTIAPHATHHVDAMIAMIARLIESGNAYVAEGHVLFHVPSDPDYGALGRRDREAMIAGARVDVAAYKQDPADFVLWKPSSEGVIGWDSPWGRGRPGWHIECSAMIAAHLGETIDIHGGGLDLIFPHHENELAQSRCAHGGAPLARHWVHNGFLSMAGSEKMSKSLGNVVTPAELLAAGHKGETLRLALLSAHYRQPLEWSEALVAQSKATLDRWYRRLEQLEALAGPNPGKTDGGVVQALSDDLNTPQAISRVSQAISVPRSAGGTVPAGDQAWEAVEGARLMGLLSHAPEVWFRGTHVVDAQTSAPSEASLSVKVIRGEQHIQERIMERAEAKTRRDFAEADRIRDELSAEGVVLEDGPNGTSWRRV